MIAIHCINFKNMKRQPKCCQESKCINTKKTDWVRSGQRTWNQNMIVEGILKRKTECNWGKVE